MHYLKWSVTPETNEQIDMLNPPISQAGQYEIDVEHEDAVAEDTLNEAYQQIYLESQCLNDQIEMWKVVETIQNKSSIEG